jgi:hypothetical protein
MIGYLFYCIFSTSFSVTMQEQIAVPVIYAIVILAEFGMVTDILAQPTMHVSVHQ